MKICYWIPTVLAVGAFCVDGADARARQPRHRPPAADETAAKLAVKPAKSKPLDPAAARRAAERGPRPDLYGNIKNATGTAPAAAGGSAATEGSAANGRGKAGPNYVPTKGQGAGFSPTPTPAGTAGRVPAARVLPPPALGAAVLAGRGPSISGTGMSRPGAATAALGGPTKAAAVVNGTGMRPKH
jgi:hypothetical protein